MAYCDICARIKSRKLNESIKIIQEVYSRDDKPWYIGFSGGKDSSLVIKLVFNALMQLKVRHKPITILYCDTGVEIPLMHRLVKRTLLKLSKEAEEYDLPIKIKIARPKLVDRYFVKVIGRGYPPPTNKFRWCTDRLRINPINETLQSTTTEKIVVLGVRTGESLERDKTISKYSTDDKYFLKQKGSKLTQLFSPIIDYSTKEVWSGLLDLSLPNCIDAKTLAKIYKDAGSECPIIRDSHGTPCGQGRFGCWTCTVVRKDKSVSSLVSEGYDNLSDLLSFRNWLIEFRDLKEFRAGVRRNGIKGLGPITLDGRRKILRKLLATQKKSGLKLIEPMEIREIRRLWKLDINNSSYYE